MLTVVTIGPVSATTLVVDAPIIDVERIEVGRASRPCEPARHTLARFLSADLCREASTDIAREYRYRVTYLWDERSYERTLEQAPGTTIPIKLELD